MYFQCRNEMSSRKWKAMTIMPRGLVCLGVLRCLVEEKGKRVVIMVDGGKLGGKHKYCQQIDLADSYRKRVTWTLKGLDQRILHLTLTEPRLNITVQENGILVELISLSRQQLSSGHISSLQDLDQYLESLLEIKYCKGMLVLDL